MNALVVHNGIFYLFYEGSHPDVTAAGFAISQDCKTWTKYSGNPVFFAGAPGSWDSRIYRGSMIFQNNSFRYWYSGHGSDWQIGYATSPFTPLEVPDRPREVPGDYLLEQSYPNPFNPEAIIKYGVPTGTHVTITIFDELGRKISTLVNEHKTPGMYAVSWRGDNVAGGVYWYRMTAGNYTCAKRMLLVK
jgi:hypothetical protein